MLKMPSIDDFINGEEKEIIISSSLANVLKILVESEINFRLINNISYNDSQDIVLLKDFLNRLVNF